MDWTREALVCCCCQEKAEMERTGMVAMRRKEVSWVLRDEESLRRKECVCMVVLI